MLARAVAQRRGEPRARRRHDLARRAQLKRERVSRTSEEVRPKWIQRPAGPADSREDVDEGGDVVVGDPLALAHGLDGEGRGADRVEVLGAAARSSSSAAATSTRRHASMRAWSVHSSPSSGRV